ncbi:MAG: indolepyruvate oxidoreductase subunit beta [Bacillota bacterium]
MYNIILAGVGGQGTVLASKIISASALASGKCVIASETIGMAQRGGSVTSHIRISETQTVASPLVGAGQADIIIAFELSEGVRCFPYLKKGGKMVVSKGIMQPTTKYDYNTELLENFLKENVENLKLVDAMEVCQSLGSYQVLNTVLLGSALEYLEISNIEEGMKQKIKPQFLELNNKALAGGKKL